MAIDSGGHGDGSKDGGLHDGKVLKDNRIINQSITVGYVALQV